MWGPLDVEPGSCLSIRIGLLNVYIQRLDDEWMFAHSYDAVSDIEIIEKDADIPYGEWILTSASPIKRIFGMCGTCCGT